MENSGTNNTEEPHHGCWADLYGGNGISVTCKDYEGATNSNGFPLYKIFLFFWKTLPSTRLRPPQRN